MSAHLRRVLFPLLTAVLLVVVASAHAQPVTSGADVIVGDIYDSGDHGSSNNVVAFSIGTEACNLGTVPLGWIATTNQHPVVAQSMYRLEDDRLEQIGISWVKHGATAGNFSLCGTCQPSPPTSLGLGCSHRDSATANGDQSNLGPRSEVNATTGVFQYPVSNTGSSATVIDKRIQVAHADLDPALNAGAQYFVEAHFVMPDDASAGNALNNASYRQVTITEYTFPITSYGITLTGTTIQQQQAIRAWQAADPTVILEDVDVLGDGRFTVAFKAVTLPSGQMRYEYAVHNLNSDRSAMAVSVLLPTGANIQNVGFHDVDYHSGELYSGADWTSQQVTNGLRWSTTDYATNSNANALRWGTTYNFWFESDVPPGAMTIELFKPGIPASVVALCPPTPSAQFIHGYNVTPSPTYDYTFIVPVSVSPPALAGGMGATVPLGFDFPFYGSTLTEIQIGPAGYLTLPSEPATVIANQPLPDIQQPNGVIAGYWDDLDSSLGGVVRYANLGTAPNRRLVVEYYNIPHIGNPVDTESFQISLYETGKITKSYIASSQGGSGATIGLERPDGGAGMSLSYNIAGLAVANTSIEYNPTIVGATTATLGLTGTGTLGTTMDLSLLSTPQKPFILMGDQARGPFWIGPTFPPLDIGFSPLFRIIFDGIGVFRAPDPLAVTDGCGSFAVSFTSPFPSGFDYTVQAIVFQQFAPVLIMQISNSHRILVP